MHVIFGKTRHWENIKQYDMAKNVESSTTTLNHSNSNNFDIQNLLDPLYQLELRTQIVYFINKNSLQKR